MAKKQKNFYQTNKTAIISVSIIVVLLALVLVNNTLKPEYQEVYNEKPLKGTGDILITEYSDYQCPACKGAYFTVERLLEEYDGEISLEYKHFPLRSIHPYAQSSAEAAECANDQGKFWEYTDLLFQNSPALTKRDLKNYASQLGLNKSFDACLDSSAKKVIVDSDYSQALKIGLTGTPSFFVNGVQMEWVTGLSLYDNLKTMIDVELAK